MTDFNNQNNTDLTQKYSPLTSDSDNPSYNITPEPQIIQTNITPEENKLNNSTEYIIYKTPYNSYQILSFNIMVLFSFIINIIIIIENYNNVFTYLSIMLTIFFLFLGCCITYCYYIIYDSSLKRIILRKEKIFKCIKKNQIIQINDIKKITFKKYKDSDAEHCFKVNFILSNEKNITAADASERGGEYIKVFQNLKKVVPEEIYFEEI